MNHQSVLDIPVAVLSARPRLPAIVTRKRYARTPIMAHLLRFLRWPVVDTEGDPGAAFRALVSAVHHHPALMIYPESHRTKTGEIGSFFPAGLWILFKTERRPVYLIVGDGFRACSHWRDLFTSLGEVAGKAEVIGPFHPPPAEELRGFIEDLRQAMVAKLAEMRKDDGSR
jgi:1-acyl-sn-glycerol-3-phosphate acyltransferase